jgi:c-di-GMP-related signal transduction protein
MKLYIARQPIFNRSRSIVAYELLHRESLGINTYETSDGDYATSSVITGTFLTLGFDALTDDKLAYVNFTESLLLKGVPQLLPKDQLVIEILETVEPTAEIINACTALKVAGYTIALDDYVLRPGYDALIALADIIKVDFRSTRIEDQMGIINRFSQQKISFLAEKVETEAEFTRAMKMGYKLFQGYFFSRPVILSTNAIPVTKLGYIQLIQAINTERPNFNEVIRAIENDVALSLETIKLVNSAYFARRNKISSIKDAVVMLGLEGVRKWINISALSRLGKNKPDVLISNSLIRSKFMELMSKQLKRSQLSPHYSMLGLLSLLDALTNCSFDILLSKLNIDDEIKAILVDKEFNSLLGQAYKLMTLYERGSWDEANGLAVSLGVQMDTVADIYMQSLEWHNSSIGMSKAAAV